MNDRMYIFYPHGRMELVLPLFFPCMIRDARIIFPLINQYAEEPEKEKLRQYLSDYVQVKKAAVQDMEADHQCGRRRPGRNYHHTQALLKRAQRNLEFLED